MGTRSIRHVVEATLATYLSTQTGLTTVQFLTGDSNVTQTLPKATLFSNADDTTLADHRLRCAALSGNMNDVASIQAAFAATGDATCYDVTPRSEDEGIDERSWATSFAYDVLTVLPPA